MEPQLITKNRILVDTDVFSYIFHGDTQAQFFRPYLLNKTLAVSFMTVAQLYYGAYKANWGQSRITHLENQLKNYVILPYDYLVCQYWAQVRKECESHGHSIEHADNWIAACALRYDCALATNNRKHFEVIKNLELISPGFL
jgi:predicted nucleic acid-binding protein